MNPQKPILIFDGDCGFCRMWIARWKALTGESIDYAPYQDVAADFPQIPVENFQKAVQLVEPDGSVRSGADAVFRSLSHAPGKAWLLKLYAVPFFTALCDFSYRTIARHRDFFMAVTRIFWGHNVLPSTYFVSYRLFFRMLAVMFFIAFASLWTQISGLAGSNGIVPVAQFLKTAGNALGASRHWNFPTLCWIDSSDAFLQFLCAGGTLLSAFLFSGILPRIVLFLLWVFYLSLSVVAQDFLSFQWDVLLLEAGFLAIFLAPPGIVTSRRSAARSAGIFRWLLRWLLFRLMFSSGVVKLLSGDPTWRNLSAMSYHYETQPLPTPVGWYVYHLPLWFQHTTTFLVLLCELVIPFFVFFPRRLRTYSFWIMVIFQIMIGLTGNYAFFNLLSITLCLPLLDDESWPDWIRRSLPAPVSTQPEVSSKRSQWITLPAFFFLLFLSILQMAITLGQLSQIPNSLLKIVEVAEPFRTVNRYGLFAVMTTSRPEIAIEGSNDGEQWKAYEFKYKPGDLKRAPSFVEPHQPRLDWQMWFAALESYDSNNWFIPFCSKLLQGSPEVLSLLARNPFPDHPPRYIRAEVYQYHFTKFSEKRESGQWWKRDGPQEYSPVFSLRNRR
jgi:predicted DCC family thiol-disulfide oxidoreductase YuxK